MKWSAQNFLEWSSERLKQAGVESPRFEAEILLTGALNLRREDLYSRPDRLLNEEQLESAQKLARRRARREPASHILGRREFWSLEFKVTRDVLAPRPETELLIERFLEMARENDSQKPLRVLDIGTGSGNIAVTLAKECPRLKVTAVDISSGALEVAKENAKAHGVHEWIRFIRADLFPDGEKNSFDYIVSNPPYIETKQIPGLMPEVARFEPSVALDGGPDGLMFYRRIVPASAHYLKPGGALIFEIGETQAENMIGLIAAPGNFESPVVTRDYGGRDRIVSARRISNG